MPVSEWSLQEAKNHFSAVVEAALQGMPQRVNRRGQPAVVVLSSAEYERLRRCERNEAPPLNEWLLAMPQDDGEFDGTAPRLRDVEF